MPLQLRVIATGQLLEVPEDGQTIGREGGDADVQLQDNGLAGRHARIFADGSEWLIQDLGSTNGTLLGGIKLTSTTPLQLDDIITIGATKLEVAKMWDPELQRTMMVAAPIFDTVPTGTPAVTRRTNSSSPKLAPVQDEEPAREEEPVQAETPNTAKTVVGGYAAMDPALIGAEPAKPKKRRAAPVEDPPEAEEGADGEEAADEQAEAPEEEAPEAEVPAAKGGGIGYFLVAVPKAIAFYLAAMPLMAVNPIGTIRKGIENQKHEAKGRMELIAYAIPPNLFVGLIGWICTVIVQLRYGTLNIMSILPIVPIISALIGAIVTGFIWHPVMGWIINKAKGESDERSRTNYFLMFQTGLCVVAIPNALGTLLAMVPFRLILILPPVLGLAGTLVSLFISYSWLNHFNVVKWLPKVVLGFAAISAVFAVLGVISALTTAPGGGTVGGGDAAAQIAAAQKQAEEALKEANAAVKEGEAAVKEAKGEAEKPAAAEKPPAAEGSIAYPAYVQMRDAVEKAINDDPTLLTSNAELKALYRQYTTATADIDNKFKALDKKNPGDAKLNERLREAELFEKTEKSVVALHGQLTGAKPKAEARPAAAAKEEPKAEAKPAAAKEEKPKAEAKPAAAKEEKPKAEAKPAAAKEEKPKAEAKPAPAKEEKPKAEAKPAEAKPAPAAKPSGKGKLACSSKPPGAEIWVDGKNTGKKTPLAPSSALEVPAGKHTVLLKLNGKSSAPQEINVDADQQVTLKGIEIPGA